MKRLAIIGSGIAGLGCAHWLHPHVELVVYEKNPTVGGHVNTVTVTMSSGEPLAIDTGFMVYNLHTYPLLCRLFKELGVEGQATDMSFSVQHRPQHLEWGGASWNQLFGQRRNLFRPGFWRMLLSLDRFNREAALAVDDVAYHTMTIEEYVTQRGYDQRLLDWFLLPMSSAIWSTHPDRMRQFPIRTLLRFFHNHRFLGMGGHLQWYTVPGGAKTYVDRLIAPFKGCIKTSTAVSSVVREGRQILVYDQHGEVQRFDAVIMATHADEALKLLQAPTGEEFALLSKFPYEANMALLHTDGSVMPQCKRVWSAWNYRLDHIKVDPAAVMSQAPGEPMVWRASTHYWMNRLQQLPGKTPYLVSINGDHLVNKDLVVARIPYHHPTFTLAGIEAQPQLNALNEAATGIYFCGSYFKYGFHEDALGSAVALCRQLLPTLAEVPFPWDS